MDAYTQPLAPIQESRIRTETPKAQTRHRPLAEQFLVTWQVLFQRLANRFISPMFHAVVVAGTGRTDADHVSSCTQIDPNGDVHSADLAMDGNEATCARTCFQRGAWLRVKINTNAGEYVRNVTIRGTLGFLSVAFQCTSILSNAKNCQLKVGWTPSVWTLQISNRRQRNFSCVMEDRTSCFLTISNTPGH